MFVICDLQGGSSLGVSSAGLRSEASESSCRLFEGAQVQQSGRECPILSENPSHCLTVLLYIQRGSADSPIKPLPLISS